jgi:hypothetical protein
MCWHTRNQGERSTQHAHGIWKAMGVLAGIPDIFVLGPERRLIGLECKAPRKRLKSGALSNAAPGISQAQRETFEMLGDCDVRVVVVQSIEEAEQALIGLGVPLKGRSR